MKRTTLGTVIVFAAGAAHAQVTFEPIAQGYVGTSISADGDAMAGNSADGIYETFRWTRAGGIVRLGRSTVDVFGVGAGIPGISHDGTRISATIADATTTFMTPGLWVEGQGWTDCLPPLLPDSAFIDNSWGSAWCISGDGQTLGGLYWRSGLGGSAHGLLWTQGGGPVSISGSGDGDSRLNAMNDDGTVVVGWEALANGTWQPHAWRSGVDYTLTPTDAFCEAYGVNGSGDIVVGQTNIGPILNLSRVAAVWTWNGASYDESVLDSLPGTPIGMTGQVFAEAATEDGNLIVGTNQFVANGPFSTSTGLMWTPRTGSFDIVDYMGDNGIVLGPDVQVVGLPDITPDGSTIIVLLQDTTTIELGTALLHIPVACSPADITTQGAAAGNTNYGMPDGLVTAADIQYYVNLYVGGDLNADLTTQGAGSGDPGFGVPDGLVTAADIQYYVNLYVAGCS